MGARSLLVEIVVHAVNVICIYHGEFVSGDEAGLFFDRDSFVILCDFTSRRDSSPIACLR